MNVTICQPSDLGPAELERWGQIQAEDPSLSSPFLSAEFAQAVDRVRSDVRLAVLEDDSRIIGFFCFQKRGQWGKAVGAGVSDCQGFVVSPRLSLDPSALLTACGIKSWEFDHLLAEQARRIGARSSLSRSWVMDLSNGFAEYLLERQAASAGTMRSMQRKARKLQRDHDVEYVDDDRRTSVLDTLRGWKSAQYRRTGRRDRFAQRWITELTENLMDSRTPDCCGQLSSLWADDELIAAHFGLRSRTTLAGWFPAFNRDFSRYSPGFDLFLRMAEAGADRGVPRFDLGKGDEPYKLVLANANAPVAEGRISVPSLAALAQSIGRMPGRTIEREVLKRPRARKLARELLAATSRLRSPP